MSWDTAKPDFTDCFLNTAMTWPPLIGLWLGAVLYFLYLCRLPLHPGYRIRSCLNCLKIVRSTKKPLKLYFDMHANADFLNLTFTLFFIFFRNAACEKNTCISSLLC